MKPTPTPEMIEAARNAIARKDITFANCDSKWQLSVAEAALSAVYPTKEGAEGYGHGGHDVRPLYAAPLAPAGWRPIAEADKGIAYIHDFAGLRIGNSYPIWAREADGRIFECVWSDNGKKAYWWDLEGESPVDPVEFMPHPLVALGGASHE